MVWTPCCCATSLSSAPREGSPIMQTVIAGRETTAAERLDARRHLLDLDDWRPDELLAVMARAEAMLRASRRANWRRCAVGAGQSLLRGSTRTAFVRAGRWLGADITNVTAAASSVARGESLSIRPDPSRSVPASSPFRPVRRRTCWRHVAGTGSTRATAAAHRRRCRTLHAAASPGQPGRSASRSWATCTAALRA
jgi:hypothetical protein